MLRKPKFPREIQTRQLDEGDFALLQGHVRIIDEDGSAHALTLDEMNEAGMGRVTAARDILTGEWRKLEGDK